MAFFRPNVDRLSARTDIPRLMKALKYPDHRWTPVHRFLYRLIVLFKYADYERQWALDVAEPANVRQTAAEALGRIGDPRAIPALIAALTDRAGYVRAAAAEALDRLSWKPEPDATGATYWIAKRDWSGSRGSFRTSSLACYARDLAESRTCSGVAGFICSTDRAHSTMFVEASQHSRAGQLRGCASESASPAMRRSIQPCLG